MAAGVNVSDLDVRPFYTIKTLAKRLTLSTRTVEAMLRRGTIPSYKVEGARRIDPDDVDRYLAERRQGKAA